MEKPYICDKCNKPVLKSFAINKNNKHYHSKCINSEAQSSSNEKEQILKDFARGRGLTQTIKKKYSGVYFGKTLLTETVRPYLQFKYKIKKNKYLELVPQISLYFKDIEEEKVEQFIKNGGLEIFKKELNDLLGDDFSIVLNNVMIGSFLTKICVFAKKIKSLGNKAINKMKNLLSRKTKEVELVKNAIDCIHTHSFKCIEDLKPSAIKFVNQMNLESKNSNEKAIKDFLNEQIETKYDAMSNWSLDTKGTSINCDDIEEEELNEMFANIKTIAENEEFELKNEIKNIQKNEKFNAQLKMNLENAFKESIFEYKITGLVIIDKDNQREIYEKEKSNCPNCQTKILFHATEIQYSSKILTTNFIVGRDNWYGMGVYFADQFDYAKFYYKRDDNFATIPKINDSFSIVVSEVYYDKTKFKHIYNYDYEKTVEKFPTEEELKGIYKKYTVPKNGIHYIEVDTNSGSVINNNKEIVFRDGKEKLENGRLIGREYCVTSKEQIYPLYGLNFQRVDYCIVWRDSNFENPYWKEGLEKEIKVIREMTGYNLYTENNTDSALKLIYRKRFNKIILISNIGKNLEGKKFVDKVRRILGFNIMVLFFANDPGHLDWIKDYPNSLFCTDDYTILEYIVNFNEKGFKDIRNKIRDFYCIELPEQKDAFKYPLFEQFKDSDILYSQIDCGEYKDFD